MKVCFLTKIIILLFFILNTHILISQVPHPDLGLRAEWMKGSWGLNWKPGRGANGAYESENYTITHFLDQIDHLQTLDYIQIHLNESSIYSPIHAGPHELIESFWQGDTNDNGNIINLAVPRAEIGRDPFLDIINEIRSKGLKVMVYVNSFNLLNRNAPTASPTDFPDVTNRWMEWCDTNETAQNYINAQEWRDYEEYPNRKYMFCYAEFILKDYAIRYGDLVDAWCFDSGRAIWQSSGDVVDSDDVNEQRLYQAFADACHAGNPNASIAFQNSPGDGAPLNPFTPATLFDDYMFGHPFHGGQNVGSNENNQWLIDWSVARNGYAHIDDGKDRTWDDYVVAHYDPPMSSNQWNTGSTPGVPDEEFAEYYGKLLLGGGALSLGVSLVGRYNFSRNLLAQDWALNQMELLDEYLLEHEIITPEPASETVVHITKSNAPNFALDGNYGGENAQDVYLWAANENNENQQWIEIDRGNGYYSYQKMGTNFCIDGGAIGASNGQNVYLWNCIETNQNQQWQKVEQTDGSYRLVKRNDAGFAINSGDGGENRQEVNLWIATHPSTNLNWIIEPINVAAKAINELNVENNVTIFPNPVTATSIIQGAANSKVSFYDIKGSELLTKEILTDNEALDLSILAAGIYYAQVKGENNISILKIIKK